jgi:hypothetical protein
MAGTRAWERRSCRAIQRALPRRDFGDGVVDRYGWLGSRPLPLRRAGQPWLSLFGRPNRNSCRARPHPSDVGQPTDLLGEFVETRMHFAESLTGVSGLAACLFAVSLADGIASADFLGITESGFAARLLAGNLTRGFKATGLLRFAQRVTPAGFLGITESRFASRLLARNFTRGFDAARLFGFAQRVTPPRFFGVSQSGFAARFFTGNLPRGFQAARFLGFAGGFASRIFDFADSSLARGVRDYRIGAQSSGGRIIAIRC